MNEHSRDVFISYNIPTCSTIVEKIVNALNLEGISSWRAIGDCQEEYPDAIVDAIHGCKVFLLILNSSFSRHCENELSIAFNRFKQNEKLPIIPFKVETCHLSKKVYYLSQLIEIMDGTMYSEEEAIRLLVKRIRYTLEEEAFHRPMGRNEWSLEENSGRLVSSVAYPDVNFTGRKKELEQIHEQLTGAQNQVCIVGMGGIGKSEIAKKYMMQYGDEYDVMIWTSCSESLCHTLSSDHTLPVRGLSHEDCPHFTEREYFYRKLQVLKGCSDRRVLIVVDNFDREDDPDLEEVCRGNYSLLFTSRQGTGNTNIPTVEITALEDEKELLNLFMAEYKREITEAEEKLIIEIINLLEKHTLLVRLVASAMRSQRISAGEMLELLTKPAGDMMRRKPKAADRIYGNLRQVFMLTALSEEEMYVLKNLSLISVGGISVSAFKEWCELEDFDVIDGLIGERWINYNPAADEMHLHPLIAELVAETLKDGDMCCEALLKNLELSNRETTDKTYEYKARLYEHAGTIYKRLPETHPCRKYALGIMAACKMAFAMYDEAIRFYKQLAETEQDFEKEVYYLEKIAHCCSLSGDMKSCHEAAVEGWEKVNDIPAEKMSKDLAYGKMQLLMRLIESERGLKQYESSIGWSEKAVQFYKQMAEKLPESSLAWSEYHAARSWYMKGDQREAESSICHAKEIFGRLGDTWGAAHSEALLGQILMKKGMFEEALCLNQNAYEVLVSGLGKEHTDIANNLEWRGDIFWAMGDKESAEECYRRAVKIYTKRHCMERAAQIWENTGVPES